MGINTLSKETNCTYSIILHLSVVSFTLFNYFCNKKCIACSKFCARYISSTLETALVSFSLMRRSPFLSSSLRVVASRVILWMFHVGGFRLKVVGRAAPSSEASIVALAPHSSFFDSIAMVFLGGPSVVAKGETAAIPFFGSTWTLSIVLFKRVD